VVDTFHSPLTSLLCDHLAAELGSEICTNVAEPSSAIGSGGAILRHRMDFNPAPVLEALLPLRPRAVVDVSLDPDIDAHLQIPEPPDLADLRLTLVSEDDALTSAICNRLQCIRLAVEMRETEPVPAIALESRGLGREVRDLVAWLMTRADKGIARHTRDASWIDNPALDRKHAVLRVAKPEELERPPRARWMIEVASDDPVAGQTLVDELGHAGFRARLTEPPCERRFGLRLGPFGAVEQASALALELADITGRWLLGQGVSPRSHPLRVVQTTGLVSRIDLPLASYRAGELRPWAGQHPARFDLILETDDPAYEPTVAHELREHLGLASASWVPLESAPNDGDFSIQTPPDAIRAPILDALEANLRSRCQTTVGGGQLPPFRRTASFELESTIVVRLPIGSWRDAAAATATTGGQGPAESISEPPPEPTPSTSRLHAFPGAVSGTSDRQEDRPFLHADEGRVHIGALTLEKFPSCAGGIPPASSFDHYCIDQPTAELLAFLAESVHLAQPCLLIGETGTSKSSSVLYLASLLDQPVIRVNLSGHSDVADLVGRYVPQTRLTLPLTTDELLATGDYLEEQTATILKRAQEENRAPTPAEISHIVANEKLPVHAWRWHDGPVLDALTSGAWLLLDEVNLADPFVLERLNSILEAPPTLLLAEHDGSFYGPGGKATHPRFRIFATMNPASYAGRRAMSPAWLDRWKATLQVRAPDEAEHLAMLHRLAHGRHPAIRHDGRIYRPHQDPPVAWAEALAELADLLPRLAAFHGAVERATRGIELSEHRLGQAPGDSAVFTRRTLLASLEWLACQPSPRSPATRRRYVERCYQARVASAEDRRVLLDLAVLTGLLDE
jgi:MoxR-like ATPase